MIVGTAAAGILVSTLGAGWALIGDAATYVAGVTFLIALTVPAPAAATARRSLLADIGDGWREVRSRLWLWPVLVQFSFVNALSIGAFLILGPYVSTATLGGARSWGLIMSSWAVGLLAGGVVASRLRPRYPLRTGTAWVFLMALPPLALALGLALGLLAGAVGLAAGALAARGPSARLLEALNELPPGAALLPVR
jgi:hypothetical protein